MPLFPIVPQLPGVPPVFRNFTNNSLPSIGGVDSDGPGIQSASGNAPQWGLYDSDGNQVLVPDSVVALDDFLHEFTVSDFPVEQGTFSSYNKVAKPFEGRFIMNKGGTQTDRSQFLDSLETIVGDTNLYALATPEKAYLNVNMTAYRYRRRAENGFQLISVEVRLIEIRVAASPQFSSTQDPTAQGSVNNGAVQPQNPTDAQTTQAQSGLSTSQGVGTIVSGPPGD